MQRSHKVILSCGQQDTHVSIKDTSKRVNDN